MRRYNSFLVRCWIIDGDTWRIQVEHVQSGEQTQVALLEEAEVWIRVHCDKPPVTAQGDDSQHH